MRTSNPTLSDKAFMNLASTGESMTVDGVVNRSFIMFLLLLAPAAYVWSLGDSPYVSMFMIGGIIGGLVLALITVFKKTWSPVTAPMYAFFEGMVIGGLSLLFERSFPGIVVQAVALTFGVFFAMLFLYKSRIIKVTEKFRMGVFAATMGIMLVYVISIVLGFFGMNIPMIHESGLVGILFSVFVVIIAALNLVLDFDFIDKGAQHGAPKYMEWYAAFGLMVTLIWLYIEILRLLSKLRSRD